MIQSVNRALNILEFLSKNIDKEFRLSDIANELKLNHATCANLLKTLINRGYVTKVYPYKTYSLGPMAYQLPQNQNYKDNLVKLARPEMESLSEKLNESVVLTIFEQNRCFIIEEVKAEQTIQVQHDSLYIQDVSKKATGRLLLSHLSRERREQFMDLNQISLENWKTDIKSLNDLHQLLDKIKTKEIHVFSEKDLVGLAAPVSKGNEIIAALGVYLPVSRYENHNQGKIKEVLEEKAKNISIKIG